MSRHFSIFALCFISLLLFCGCAAVREARKVQEAPREEMLPGEYTAQATELGLDFSRPLTLAELEEAALRHNPSVLQAQLAVSQAMLSLANAKAENLPTLNTSLSHSRSTHNTNRHRTTTSNTGSWSGGLNFGIMLYDFGKTAAAVRQAQDELAAAEAEYQSAQTAAVHTVRTAYFSLMRAKDLHQVAVEAVQQYKEHLDQVRLKKEVGSGLTYDITKAEVDWHNARLTEITAANDIAVAWADLNLALGLAEEKEFELQTAEIKSYAQSADELLAMAKRQEPAFRALEYRVSKASAAVDAAIAELYPTISLSLGASLTGRNLGLPWLWNLSGALSAAENLYNGGRNRNAIRSAAVALRAARSRYAAHEQSVYRNLRAAVLTARRAQRQYEVALLTARSAKENLDIVNEKYKHGKASSVDRTDAQVSYSKAKANAVTAHFDYQEAQAHLAYLIGE